MDSGEGIFYNMLTNYYSIINSLYEYNIVTMIEKRLNYILFSNIIK